MWNVDWHDSSTVTNRGKKREIRPKQCVQYFTSWHNGRIVMEYLLCPNDHLFVAYAAPKKVAENSDFIRLLGQKPKLAIAFWRVFLQPTRVGQTIAMRPQFVPNARPRDESMQLVLTASR